MKCPFRKHTEVTTREPQIGRDRQPEVVTTTEEYEECYGNECMAHAIDYTTNSNGYETCRLLGKA